MPIVAASLEEAISITNDRVDAGSSVNSLLFQIQEFNILWEPEFSPSKETDRDVRNWFPLSNYIGFTTPQSGNTEQKQAVVDVTTRTMFATITAHSAGRITTAQRDAMLFAWNNSFGLIP